MRLALSTAEMRTVGIGFSQQAERLTLHAAHLRELVSRASDHLSIRTSTEHTIHDGHLRSIHTLAQIDEAVFTIEQLSLSAHSLSSQISAAADRGGHNEQTIWTEMKRLAEHPGLVLSAPGFVASMRSLATHIDLPLAAVTGGPLGLWRQVFNPKPGPDFAASMGARATNLVPNPRTHVTVSKTQSVAVNAPTSLSELARRVPRSEAGQPQVRIEKYRTSQSPSWIVYCGGTVSMKPASTDEPWDMRSNLEVMAGQQSDSLEAVQVSMQQAGIAPGDDVLFVGFSQGGMLAAELARQADVGHADLVTFGAPIAQIDLNNVDGAIAVEHREDLVPALAGAGNSAHSDRLIIAQRAFASVPIESGLPAHNMDRYANTVANAESAPNRDLRIEKQKIMAQISGSGQSTLWRADRTVP